MKKLSRETDLIKTDTDFYTFIFFATVGDISAPCVCEEMGVMDFTGLGKMLCFSLSVWLLMFLCLFPEARGTNSSCPGWAGSESESLNPAVVY